MPDREDLADDLSEFPDGYVVIKRQHFRGLQFASVYIGVVLTILLVLVAISLGTNRGQDRKLAEQAAALAISTRASSLQGCERNNYIRKQVTVVSTALELLIRKQVEGAVASGHVLTPSEEKFVKDEYRRLHPVGIVNCDEKYPPVDLNGHPVGPGLSGGGS